MSNNKKRKDELKEKYVALFSGEQKRLRGSGSDVDQDIDIGMHKLFNIIIIKINMIKFNFKLQIQDFQTLKSLLRLF